MNEQRLRMRVDGMTCASCERHVVQALERVGVRDARADFRRGEATFMVDSGTNLETLAQAVAEADYVPGPVDVVVAPPEPSRPPEPRRVPSVKPVRVPCPACGEQGKPVDTITLKALLAVPLTVLRPVEYRFCRTPDCPTVYYSAGGVQQFGEDTLRERVHQKHPTADDVFVCYCFRHTLGSIRTELVATGRSAAVQDITAGVQAGQCACEIRNPQGSCCLGNVGAVVRRVESEVGAPAHAGHRA